MDSIYTVQFFFSQHNLLSLYRLSVGLTQGETGVPCPPFTYSATRMLSTGLTVINSTDIVHITKKTHQYYA